MGKIKSKIILALKKKYPNLKLLLVGVYEDNLYKIDKETEQLINESNAIITAGFQQDTRKFLSITDLFTLPSYREGLSNALIEAGSFGVPLLATDIIGNNEVIQNNVTGVLVKMKDVSSLTNGIEKFITDKKFYSYIKNNVRGEIIKKYNQNYFWKELECEFRKTI